MFAVNTNWAVFMDMSTSQYYLLDGNSWFTSPDPPRPWQPVFASGGSFEPPLPAETGKTSSHARSFHHRAPGHHQHDPAELLSSPRESA